MNLEQQIATLDHSYLSDLVERSCTRPLLIGKNLMPAVVSEIRHRGILGLFGLVFRRSDEALRTLAEGNMMRRKIRWPWFFTGLILWMYGKSKRAQARIQLSYFNRVLEQSKPERVFIWNGYLMPFSILRLAAEQQKLQCTYFENGYFPQTLQVDNVGINGRNSIPRCPEFFQNLELEWETLKLPDKLNNRAGKIKGPAANVDLTQEYYFVPMQVPSDMQVLDLSPWVKSMEAFYDVLLWLVEQDSGFRFIVKEHPSFKRKIANKVQKHPRIIFANNDNTEVLIERSKGVVTLNSTVGIEALFKKKPVFQLGLSCYGIAGLVNWANNREELLQRIQSPCYPDPLLVDQYIRYVYSVYLLPGTLASINAERVTSRSLGTDSHSLHLSEWAK
jgi:capsular polysaccharide export protein